MTANLDQLVQLHKALAHPVRLRIVGLVQRGELCVCQVAAVLSLAYSTISSHLAELRRAGVLAERKKGRWVYYRLAEGSPAVEAALATVERAAGDDVLAADRRLLDRACCVTPEALCEAGLDLDRLTPSCCEPKPKGPSA